MPDQFSDEQLLALLGMGDIGGEEEKLAQQQALAQQLRGTALQPSAGKDWASQLARGLQGGMAGYAQKQVNPMIEGIGQQRTDMLGKVRDVLMNKGPKMQTPQVGPEQIPDPRLNGMGYQ